MRNFECLPSFRRWAVCAMIGVLVVALSGTACAGISGPKRSTTKDVTMGENGLQAHTLDLDQQGNIYVGGGREIWVYDKNGTRTNVWQVDAVSAMRVANDGNILVGRSWEPSIHLRLYDRNGALLREFAQGKWLHGDSVGFDVPFDLAYDANGNIWSPNTHNTKEPEASPRPNQAWGGLCDDPNGGRLIFFDLKNDPNGEHPSYFGTFSNSPPESGGPADGLHLPSRVAFDAVHKKIFALDSWGVTRWNWPDGKFEARILRQNSDRNFDLLAATPAGTLFVRIGGPLFEIDSNGRKLRDLPQIDVDQATDLRVTSDGAIYLCSGNKGIAFKKYTPDGNLALCRGLNVINLSLAIPDADFTAGQKMPVEAAITNRGQLYHQVIPGVDEVKRSLWIRPYDQSSEWRRLPIETSSDGGDEVTIPADLQGACQLILSASEAAPELLDSTAASVSLNLAVKSPQAKNGSITVSTDRNQQLLVGGQWVRANVIGRSVAGVANETVQVRFLDAKGKVTAEKTGTWSIPKGGSTNMPFDLTLSSRLPVGDYSIQAISPSLGTNEEQIHVGAGRESGRFALFTAMNLGVDTSYETVRGMTATAARDGFDHDISRYISVGGQGLGSNEGDLSVNRMLRQTLESDPLLPAPESAEIPTRMRLALNEYSVNGTHLWPETMGWETDTLNRTDAQKIGDKGNLAHWTMMGITSPAQDGFLWNESNWWGVDQARLKVQWSHATGQASSSMDGINAGEQIQEASPLWSGEKLKTLLSYVTYAARHLYPDNYTTWKNYVQQMRPDIFGAGVPAFYWHNWPEWASQPLDGVMCYHQVEQICEPYMQLNDGSLMKHDGKAFWAGVEVYPESGTGEYMARQLLPSLLWGAEGFWVNDMMGWEGGTFGHPEVLQAAHDLKAVLDPVGRRLRDTTYRPALGIYYPLAARVQGGNAAFAGAMYIKRVKSALLASFHAHIPAKVVFDEDMKAHRFDGLKFLLLAGLQTEITPDDMASLQQFKALGGVILVGKNSDSRYAGLGPAIDVDLDIDKNYDYGQSWAGDVVQEKRVNVIGLAAKLKTALAPYLTPPVAIDDPEIWYALRDGKDRAGRPVTYLIALNQNYPDTLKPYQLWKMTTDYDSIIPVVRSAVVPDRFHHAYDLLHGRALEIGNGGKIELDFRRFPAAVIALSVRPLSAAHLREAEPVQTSGPGEMSLQSAPDVDVFYARDIRKALDSGKQVFVLSENKSAQKSIADKLTQAGISAQASDQPGDGVNLEVSYPGDQASSDDGDMAPIRLTENVPGRGRAMLEYRWSLLPNAVDGILMAIADDDGLAKAVQELVKIKSQPQPAERRLVAPRIEEAQPASLQEDMTKNWGARLGAIQAAGSTVAVGADEWGNNFFLLDARDGKLRSSAKAGRYFVQQLWMSQDGDKIGAQAFYPEDINSYLEMFGPDGKSEARFARDGIDTHNNWAYSDHFTRCDIFSFALSPDGSVVYSGSNLGLSALRADGTLLWRHDYSGMDNTLELLRSMWASRIALTPDGKYLAEVLTHEMAVGVSYRGTSIIRKVDAATGNIIWEKTLDPVASPDVGEVAISPDGTTVAVIGHGALMFLRDGHIIRKRPDASDLHYSHLAWSADSTALYAIVDSRGVQVYPGIGQGTSAAQNAILAYSEEGIPLWQHGESVPIVDLGIFPQGGVIYSNGLCEIKRLAKDGDVQWKANTDAVAHVCVEPDSVFACDWHGNVYKLGMKDGAIAWKTNLTDNVWRDDIKPLLAEPYTGPTYGAAQRAPREQLLDGENVAPQATVRVQGEGGWFKSDQVNVDPRDLVDGKIGTLTRPWLGIVDQEKADNWSKFVSVEFEWNNPILLKGLSIHEDARHPESWPYHCALQAYQDGQWRDLAVRLMGPGPWHNIVLSVPQKVSKIRYWPTSIQSNNLWTDEVRVIAAKGP